MGHQFPIIVLALAVAGPARNATAQVARLGAHYGVNLTNGAWEDPRFGLQGMAHLVGPVELSGALSVFTGWPGVAGFTGSAWQVYGALRVRGPGKWAFATAGYGPVFTHTTLRDQLTGQATTENGFADSGVLGFEVPTRHVRPFLDLYLSHLLDRGAKVGVNVLMGFQVPITSR